MGTRDTRQLGEQEAGGQPLRRWLAERSAGADGPMRRGGAKGGRTGKGEAAGAGGASNKCFAQQEQQQPQMGDDRLQKQRARVGDFR